MKNKREMPFVNIRDVVIFPQMSQGLYIGRKKTIEAIQHALKGSKKILVLSQKSSEQELPKKMKDMYKVGTICSLDGSVSLKDGTMKVILTGEVLFKIENIFDSEGIQFAKGSILKSATDKKALQESERLSLLELIVRAKPLVALDGDALWFQKLRTERKMGSFFDLIQMNLNYRQSHSQAETFKIKTSKKEALGTNLKVKLQQGILEEQKMQKKADLIREYLKLEICDAVEKM